MPSEQMPEGEINEEAANRAWVKFGVRHGLTKKRTFPTPERLAELDKLQAARQAPIPVHIDMGEYLQTSTVVAASRIDFSSHVISLVFLPNAALAAIHPWNAVRSTANQSLIWFYWTGMRASRGPIARVSINTAK